MKNRNLRSLGDFDSDGISTFCLLEVIAQSGAEPVGFYANNVVRPRVEFGTAPVHLGTDLVFLDSLNVIG